MALSASGCYDSINSELALIRDNAKKVSDDFNEELSLWIDSKNQYLKDLQDYLDGITDEEPEDVGPPPSAPDTGKFPSPDDYTKAFGNGFLKYLCANVKVEFSWNGKASHISSGSTVLDTSYPNGFSVSGAGGGGDLKGPSMDDSPNFLEKFLNNLSALASGLEVTLPVTPGAKVFSPVKVKFASGAKLEAGDNLTLVTPKPSREKPTYEDTLLNLCSELVASFKSNFKSSTNADHTVASMVSTVSEGVFSGEVVMVSIS
jgi:hypothetical protein